MSKVFSLEVEGAEVLARALQGIREDIPGIALPKVVQTLTQKARDQMKAKAPKPGQKPWTTGNLLRNIKMRLQGLTGEAVADVFYAWFVERATRPHWIGSPVFIRGVGWRYIGQHPGTKAQPFAEPTLEEIKREAPSVVRTHLMEVISKHQKG